jgi:hypothetical protein
VRHGRVAIGSPLLLARADVAALLVDHRVVAVRRAADDRSTYVARAAARISSSLASGLP